jgi:hypothetical protein
MKSLIRSIARFGWRCLAPLRRPLVRKLNRQVSIIVAAEVAVAIDQRIAPLFARVNEQIDTLIHLTDHSRRETDLMLNSLLRELVRVQMQIDAQRTWESEHDREEAQDLTILDGQSEESVGSPLRQTA